MSTPLGLAISITFIPRERNGEQQAYIGGLPKDASQIRGSVMDAIRSEEVKEAVQKASVFSGNAFTLRGPAANMTGERIAEVLQAFVSVKKREAERFDLQTEIDDNTILAAGFLTECCSESPVDQIGPLQIRTSQKAEVESEAWALHERTEQCYEEAVENLRAVKEKTGLTLQI